MQCRPSDRPRARRPARPPAALQTTTIDAGEQNNTGPLGGPVINSVNYVTYMLQNKSTLGSQRGGMLLRLASLDRSACDIFSLKDGSPTEERLLTLHVILQSWHEGLHGRVMA